MLAALLCAVQQPRPNVVKVEHDDVVIRESCAIDCSGLPILDDEGDGVIQIAGDGIRVEFTNAPLVGAQPDVLADAFTGIGVRVTGKNVTLRAPRVHGFKAAIWATRADGLVIDGCDVSGNFRQRLKSTDKAEDGGDWLWPHRNDDNEWLKNYGAAIYVEESKNVVVRNAFARGGQNGICLRRVDDSAIYDNDMSWMSGWGLAMFRASGNVVDHNSFDFCIRGYSHGRYARGQDSAGILFFEQCERNLFAFNSATHGGDGFFGFAGLEALEGGLTRAGVGCNDNWLVGNDFSYAAAIGIEMTFSYGNVFEANRLVGSNYGVWGGYSGRTVIRGNEIAENTLAGIAIEHGSRWLVESNRFARNERGLELWWDEDADLLAKPWAKLNPTDSRDYFVAGNEFDEGRVQLELRGGTKAVHWDPAQRGTDEARWKVDATSEVLRDAAKPSVDFPSKRELPPLPGRRQAVGARKHLDGREKIIVTEWGPYDWIAPHLQRVADRDGAHAWRLLGEEVPIGIDAGADVVLQMDASEDPPVILVRPRKPGVAKNYELAVRLPSGPLKARAMILGAEWEVTVGAYQTDPRTDAALWRTEVARGVSFRTADLSFAYNGGGPSELADAPENVRAAKIGRERFGTLATTRVGLGAGRWKLTATSDDGVRVRVDGKTAIENWTHHGPTVDTAELSFDSDAEHTLEVEHFELDGWAVLDLELELLEGR